MSALDDTGDVVVTVPQDRWLQWLVEGDLPGDPSEEAGTWDFYAGNNRSLPAHKPGARCYVVAWGRLRGYAPMVPPPRHGHRAFVREGGAVACTIPEPIKGFQGYRYRWWRREKELAFPGWATEGLPVSLRRNVEQFLFFRSRGPEWRAGLRHWALTGDTSRIQSGRMR